MSFKRLQSILAEPLNDDAFFDETLGLMFVGVLAAAMAVAIGLLLLFNGYLVVTQQVYVPESSMYGTISN